MGELAEMVVVDRMIMAYSRGDGAATNYEIAWVTVPMQHLRAGDNSWTRSRAPMVANPTVRLAQPGYVATPASLLALANCR